MSARRRVSRRNVSGRTHRSAPTRGGERSEVNGNWYETTPCPAGRGGARPLQGERSRRVCPGRRGVVTPPYGSNTGGAQRRADVGIGPYEKESKPHQPPGPAAHSGAYAARSRGMSGNWSRDHSQRDHQRRTIPQSRLRLTAPFAQGSLGDVGIRPFYDGRGFGSSAPTEGLPKSQQRADVGIGPYGTNGSPLRLPRQRLAKRKARKEKLVKFGLCPMTSECSTAQKVRRSQQGPARVPAEAASTE